MVYYTGLSVRIVTLFLSRHLLAKMIRGFDLDMGGIPMVSCVAMELQKPVAIICERDSIVGKYEFEFFFSMLQLDKFWLFFQLPCCSLQVAAVRKRHPRFRAQRLRLPAFFRKTFRSSASGWQRLTAM
jgi:hypothetical protein